MRMDELNSRVCHTLPVTDHPPTTFTAAHSVQAGHALAAAAEGIGIHAVSFFLLLLLPGAYVTLNTDNLAVLGPSRALNVRSCALLPRWCTPDDGI